MWGERAHKTVTLLQSKPREAETPTTEKTTNIPRTRRGSDSSPPIQIITAKVTTGNSTNLETINSHGHSSGKATHSKTDIRHFTRFRSAIANLGCAAKLGLKTDGRPLLGVTKRNPCLFLHLPFIFGDCGRRLRISAARRNSA